MPQRYFGAGFWGARHNCSPSCSQPVSQAMNSRVTHSFLSCIKPRRGSFYVVHLGLFLRFLDSSVAPGVVVGGGMVVYSEGRFFTLGWKQGSRGNTVWLVCTRSFGSESGGRQRVWTQATCPQGRAWCPEAGRQEACCVRTSHGSCEPSLQQGAGGQVVSLVSGGGKLPFSKREKAGIPGEKETAVGSSGTHFGTMGFSQLPGVPQKVMSTKSTKKGCATVQ